MDYTSLYQGLIGGCTYFYSVYNGHRTTLKFEVSVIKCTRCTVLFALFVATGSMTHFF